MNFPTFRSALFVFSVCLFFSDVSAQTRSWGWNSTGQLGIGSSGNIQPNPQIVTSVPDATAIDGGEFHTVFLKADGTVVASGVGGLIGDGTTMTRSTPVAVLNLTNVIAVSAGGRHSLALKSDGTVWAWGGTSYGEIGNGTPSNSLIPVQSGATVPGFNNIVAVAASLPRGEWQGLITRRGASEERRVALVGRLVGDGRKLRGVAGAGLLSFQPSSTRLGARVPEVSGRTRRTRSTERRLSRLTHCAQNGASGGLSSRDGPRCSSWNRIIQACYSARSAGPVVEVLEQAPHDLAGCGDRHLVDELHGPRNLVGGEVLAAVGNKFLRGRRRAWFQDDVGLG